MLHGAADEINVRILTGVAEMDAIGAQWLALEDLSSDPLTYFQSYGWCRAWAAAFAGANDSRRPHVVTAWKADRLLAVWPLMQSGMAGFRKLENFGEPHSQYCNALFDPDAIDDSLAAAMIDAVEAVRGCDIAVFKGIPEASHLAHMLRRYAPVGGYADQSSMLDLSDYASSQDYAARLGRLQKRNRNRRRNHLARLGDVGFEVIWPDHPEFRDLVGRCMAMKTTWLRKTGRYSIGFAMRGYRDFLASLQGDGTALDGACLSVLRVGGRAVALELGFIRHGHYYAYIGGFDWELRDNSPGKVQMDMTVCWLIDHGIKTYDLLGNTTEYKQSWSNRDVALRAHAAPFSWKGRVYAGTWLPTIRPRIKQMFRAIPELLRRTLAIGQGFSYLLFYV